MTVDKTYKKLMKRLSKIDATQLANVSFEIRFSDGKIKLRIDVYGFMGQGYAYIDDVDVKTFITVKKRIVSAFVMAEVNRLRRELGERKAR